MDAIDIVTVSLAALYLRQAWLSGSLFNRPRAYLEARGGTLASFLMCRVCTTPYFVALVTLLLWLPAYLLDYRLAFLPLQIFAAAGLLVQYDRFLSAHHRRKQ
jgi:hypothetical protein